MNAKLEQVVVVVPPLLAQAMAELARDYAETVNESPEEVRRLIEIAVLTRGVRMMREQVELERKYAERMGWK